jgi:hypothetical protein
MAKPATADKGYPRDERGVSTTLGYTMTLAITAILMSGLLIAGGTLVDEQRERVAEDELSVSAEQLAGGLTDADQLAGTISGGEVKIKVWLPNLIAGGPYTVELENHPTSPDQPAEGTIRAEAQEVDVTTELSLRTGVPVANKTVVGGPVVISHRDADGDDSRELVVNTSDDIDVNQSDPVPLEHNEVVYVDDDSSELSSIAPDGTVTGYGVSANAIGPKQYDVDGDGLREIPYVTSSNQLRLIDEDGEIQTLASDAAKSPLQNSYGTVLAIGEWNGEITVFYMNTSDVGPNDEATIYRVGLDGEETQVTAGGNAVEANAIAGVGDVNDDGDADLVFVGLSQRIRFVDDDTVTDTGQTVSADTGIGVGAPRQFDDGEADRVPFVSSNNVRLLSYQGGSTATTDLTSSDVAAPTFVSGVDWTGDDALEVVYVDSDDGTLYYVTLGGSITQITDSDGNPIAVDEDVGVA